MNLNEWFQFIYLQNIFFKWFDSISFVFNFQKKLFTLIVSKEFITKFQFGHKNYFLLVFLKKEWIFTILFTKVFWFVFI